MTSHQRTPLLLHEKYKQKEKKQKMHMISFLHESGLEEFTGSDIKLPTFDLEISPVLLLSSQPTSKYLLSIMNWSTRTNNKYTRMPFSSTSSVVFKYAQVLLFFLVLVLTCDFLQEAEAAAAAGNVVVGNISHVEDAQYFHIYYGQTFKVIKNGIDGKSYLLMQHNSRMATKTKYCTGRIKSFIIPLSNFSVDITGFPVSFLELLGILDGLKGITSDAVASQCTLKSLSNGDITIVNSSDTKQLQMFAAHFLSSTGQASVCNSVTFAPLAEVSPLKRAEWIKYLGAFANAEVRANEVYDAVKNNYICLCKTVANQTTYFKPVVAWIQQNQGIWSFAKEEFKKQYVLDAGGETIDDSVTGSRYNASIAEDMEDFHAILCTVDVVIDETHVPEPADYTLSTFLSNIAVTDTDNTCFEFLSNKSIWRYDKHARNTKALDWDDGGITQPQLVLADLIEAFFPTGNYITTYFRNVAKGESVSNVDETTCDRSSTTPLEPTIVPCK